MKDILIWAPVRTGRSWLATRIKGELQYKGTILIVDELHPGQIFLLDKVFIIVCIGYADISPEEEHKIRPDGDSLERVRKYCAESAHVKAMARKMGLKYFDVSSDRGKESLDEILGYIRDRLEAFYKDAIQEFEDRPPPL